MNVYLMSILGEMWREQYSDGLTLTLPSSISFSPFLAVESLILHK